MPLLSVTNLSLQEHGTVALAPLSFEQRAGQRLVVAGESGAGKSTLLQLLAGLIQPSTGEVRVAGHRVRSPAEALVPGHPGVAYLSQRSELPRFLRVEQVLRYAGQPTAADAPALARLCGIDHLLTRRTDQLSGGAQQRVALARLLLGAPQLLLLDEPYANLDRAHKHLLQGIVAEVGERLGITCLLVSHEAADTLPWADEILVLRRGQLVQQGTPQQVYQQPADAYTAGLFGDYNLLAGPDRAALAPGPQAPGTALLVRPEQLRLATDGATGRVVATRFFGSYYEVDIQLTTQVVRARLPQPIAVGEVVTVAGEGWVVPA